jgi:hypothetical protein
VQHSAPLSARGDDAEPVAVVATARAGSTASRLRPDRTGTDGAAAARLGAHARRLGSVDDGDVRRRHARRPVDRGRGRTQHSVARRRRVDGVAVSARAAPVAPRVARGRPARRVDGLRQPRDGGLAEGHRRLLRRELRDGHRLGGDPAPREQLGLVRPARHPGQALQAVSRLPRRRPRKRAGRLRPVAALRDLHLDVAGRVGHAQYGGGADLRAAVVPAHQPRRTRAGQAPTGGLPHRRRRHRRRLPPRRGAR